MQKRTRTVLNFIQRELAKQDQAAKELATILSALRGPDSGNGQLKEQSTGVVRALAFPKLAEKYRLGHSFNLTSGYNWSFANRPLPSGTTLSSVYGSYASESSHFIAHAQLALDVLNSEKEG